MLAGFRPRTAFAEDADSFDVLSEWTSAISSSVAGGGATTWTLGASNAP